MKFIYKGNSNNKVAILIHLMFIHERCFDKLIKYLEDDYYLILPRLDGHYKNSNFISIDNEVSHLEDELRKNNIKEIDFIFGLSLGGIIALDFFQKNSTMINNLYIDGVPIIRLGPIMRNIFKNKFYGITCKIKNNPQEAKEKFKNPFPGMEQIVIDVCKNITKESCKNLSDACYRYKLKEIDIDEQKKIKIIFGTKEFARLCEKKLKRKYKYAQFIDNEGYAHCEYFISNIKGYAAMFNEWCNNHK